MAGGLFDGMLEPGFYNDVPFADYCGWELMNQSSLKWGLVSAEHLKAALDGKIEMGSTALSFGRAMHARLLEPKWYKANTLVAGSCPVALKSGSRKGEPCGLAGSMVEPGDGETWYCKKHAPAGSHEPESFVSSDEAARIEAIAKKVKANTDVQIIRAHGGYETSVVFELEGIQCKCRLDKYLPEVPLENGETMPFILDLKKVQVGGASPQQFSKSVARYNYDIQAAWYSDAVEQLTGKVPSFCWILVEDGYPHGVNVLACRTDTIRAGRARYQKLLGLYKECRERDEWPGYARGIQWCGLPEYLETKYLEED